MRKRSVTLTKPRSLGDPLSAVPAPPVPSAVVKARRVEHRDGAGHLEPAYEAQLRLHVRDRARHAAERAFFNGTSSSDPSAERSGEEFVKTVTSGEGGGESVLDEETSEERGGPFVETSAHVEFAHGTDRSNPAGATREPFPTS